MVVVVCPHSQFTSRSVWAGAQAKTYGGGGGGGAAAAAARTVRSAPPLSSYSRVTRVGRGEGADIRGDARAWRNLVVILPRRRRRRGARHRTEGRQLPAVGPAGGSGLHPYDAWPAGRNRLAAARGVWPHRST